MYDSQLSNLITASISRLNLELTGAAPWLATQLSAWMAQLSRTGRPEDYFKHPLAFPSLLLPWWLEKTYHAKPDLSLHSDLVYSTINGYYYIRLIDNLMDGHDTVELKLLPALGFFHTQFQTMYQHYFEPNHGFWQLFRTVWFHSAEVTIKDASLTDLDQTQFEQIAAQKTCAAKIPLAAVSYRLARPDLIEPWSQMVDTFGRWHQLHNDLFDWHRDETQNRPTYFLCEARRRRDPGQPIAAWIAGEGFAWAIEQLCNWMVALKALAEQLHSSDLSSYLDVRETMLLEKRKTVETGLQDLAKIVASDS